MRAFISISTVFIVLFISCKNGNDIEPKNLIGQWRPTYEIFNDSTQKWEVILSYMLLPNIEFTSDGKFLINNRPGSEGDCCGYIGSQYKVENNMVIFSNFAVASSFLGVTLGLFDYLADLFGFDDSAMGRFKTALLTFLPPIVGGLLWPNGFLYAIGYAGLAATIWAAIVPALLARKSRKRFGSPKFRVWGGKPMIALILVFGVGNAVIHVLSSFNLLPVYQ